MRFFESLAVVALLSTALLANVDATFGNFRRGGRRSRGNFGSNQNVIKLHNSDFISGTYRILTPGRYRLEEDIVFNPNNASLDPYENFFPTEDQFGDASDKYPQDAFRLGFFAAISVETSDVDIDLNGYSIEQGAEHALMQRFFAVIELANSPFIHGQGPHTFTSNFFGASNVTIHDGLIGRSSHHGIHGNQNANIRIDNVDFIGFEVAAVHLNGVEGLTMEDCDMESRKDVPVLGTFSAARFLQRYIGYLVDSGSSTTLDVLGVSYDALAIQDDLRRAVNNVYDDVVKTGTIDPIAHPEEYALFANEMAVADGNAYCVVTHQLGFAVNGFPYQPAADDGYRPSRDVALTNLHCRDHEAQIREVVALKQEGKTVNDPVGSVLQLLNRVGHYGEYLTIGTNGDIEDAWYVGNAVANAQIFVAKATHNGDFDASSHDVSRNSVSPAVVAWVEDGALGDLGDLAAAEGWLCNGDSMFHVQKGLASYMISGTVDARLKKVHVDRAINYGYKGSDICGDYTFSHPLATLSSYNGAHARGFSFAGSKGVDIQFSSVTNLASLYGDAVGFDVFTDSEDVDLERVVVYEVLSERGDAAGVRFGAETSGGSLRNEFITDVDAPMGTAALAVDDGANDITGSNDISSLVSE